MLEAQFAFFSASTLQVVIGLVGFIQFLLLIFLAMPFPATGLEFFQLLRRFGDAGRRFRELGIAAGDLLFQVVQLVALELNSVSAKRSCSLAGKMQVAVVEISGSHIVVLFGGCVVLLHQLHFFGELFQLDVELIQLGAGAGDLAVIGLQLLLQFSQPGVAGFFLVVQVLDLVLGEKPGWSGY